MFLCIRVSFLLFLCSILLVPHLFASDATLFGPEIVERGKGKPVVESYRFSSVAGLDVRLQVQNGDASGENRVSSLSIVLNGQEVVSGSEVNQNVGLVSHPVSLARDNILTVELNGGPGGYVEVSMATSDSTERPPSIITFQADQETIEIGEDVVLNWQTIAADIITIEPDVGVVSDAGSVLLSPAQSTTYQITVSNAIDAVSASLTVTVLPPDVVEPPAAQIQASPPTIDAGMSAELNWSTTHAESVTIEPGIGTVSPSGSLTVTPSETTLYTLTAVNEAGVATTTVEVQVVQIPTGPTITIDDIFGDRADGATVSTPYVTLSGSLQGDFGVSPVVIINGQFAEIDGSRFLVNRVPLAEGWNEVDVAASTESGQEIIKALQINSAPQTNYPVLRSYWMNGAAPLQTNISFELPYVQLSGGVDLTCSGPGSVELARLSEEEFDVTFTQAGLFDCVARATDVTGQEYQDRLGIRVWDEATLDQELQVKWASMKQALLDGDVEGALGMFTEHSREFFRPQFELMGSHVSQVVAKMGTFRLEEVKENRVVYDMRSIKDGVEYSFQVDFVRDRDGRWRIWTF